MSSEPSKSSSYTWLTWHPNQQGHHGSGCPMLSDFGCNVPPPESHPANKFLVDWFSLRGESDSGAEDIRLCSHSGCGRPETRKHEFRRCSVCGSVNYCSRACQALDWKLKHKLECTPMEQWPDEEEIDGDAADNRLENAAAADNVDHNNVGIIQS